MQDKEIIERVREDIFKDVMANYVGYMLVDKILSHKNIAIIDPDAELPSNWWHHGFCQTRPLTRLDAKEAGWRKEVK